jgi:hypothetical protein
VEWLKAKALSSSPSTAKNKKKFEARYQWFTPIVLAPCRLRLRGLGFQTSLGGKNFARPYLNE